METKELFLKQRSDAWFQARSGRVTASNISSILGKEGLKKTESAIKTYSYDKAQEELGLDFDDDDQFISKDMQRGIDLEPMAARKFSEILNQNFMSFRECGFFTYGSDAGCSPDGLVYDLEMKELLSSVEIKCPRPQKFLRIFHEGESAIDKTWMDQMQMQMMVTNTNKCFFVIYMICQGREFIHYLTIKRDQERIDLIKSRINDVVKQKKEIIKHFKTTL